MFILPSKVFFLYFCKIKPCRGCWGVAPVIKHSRNSNNNAPFPRGQLEQQMTSSIISCYSQSIHGASICCYIFLVSKAFLILPAPSQRKLKEKKKKGASFHHVNKCVSLSCFIWLDLNYENSDCWLFRMSFMSIWQGISNFTRRQKWKFDIDRRNNLLEQGFLKIRRRLIVNLIFKAECTTAQESTKISHCHLKY